MPFTELLAHAIAQDASDIHLAVGQRPALRIAGQIIWQAQEVVAHAELDTFLQALIPEILRDALARGEDLDFAATVNGQQRVRVNISSALLGMRVVMRLVPATVPRLDTLQVPTGIMKLLQLEHGLILVTGPTGSGKTTTLAAMLEWLNQQFAYHVLTLEDPVEFQFTPAMSFITQREVSGCKKGFQLALRSALRQDPDVIMLGEMRDAETIALALTAAETGHLVLATLHASRAAQAIDRLVDAFPQAGRESVRSLLAMTLQGVIAQRLMTMPTGGRRAIFEVMLATSAVRNLIREGKTAQLYTAMQTGSELGMQTLEQAQEQLRY